MYATSVPALAILSSPVSALRALAAGAVSACCRSL